MNSNALYTVEHDGIYNVDVKFSPELADFNDWKPLSSMLLCMIEYVYASHHGSLCNNVV